MDKNEDKKNFIEEEIDKDLESKRYKKPIKTRFPPEPNGYLHIGHAKSICLNFALAQKYNGQCNLRFDDTNPITEEAEYVKSIKKDVKWLGYEWHEQEKYASDYFEQLYEWAIQLIKLGKAYVDDENAETIAEKRGTPQTPTIPSEFRNRGADENLRLLREMKEGKYAEGEKVLRAKIDLSAPNMHMRDPVIYRIVNKAHHRTKNTWHIYPMYDWAHGLSDSIEGITHSICTLEFENHRPLYEWFINALNVYAPRQIEFARLNVSHTITSKRKLKLLVDNKLVDGWDDPRMPTIAGMRRRGVTPQALRDFCVKVGVTKRDNLIDHALLEHCIRADLNKVALRKLGIIDPIVLEITNYPDGAEKKLPAVNNPENKSKGKRELSFSKRVYINRADFMIDAPKKYFRLAPGRVVRLKYAYIVECTDYKVDKKTGKVTTVYCKYYKESKSGSDTSGIKVKGTIGWVNVNNAVEVNYNMYDRLFNVSEPDISTGDINDIINPKSLVVEKGVIEESILDVSDDITFQIERVGYFIKQKGKQGDGVLTLNRTCTLRDNWEKVKK